MLYDLLRPIVTVAVFIFYRKITVVNQEKLSQPGATLIIANHTNAFMDALVVSIFTRKKVYSIARGDVFKNKWVAGLLHSLYIIPIFRQEDGMQELLKNEASFERCVDLLQERQYITIYPEGNCITEKRLRKLRKGAARIALRAEDKSNFDLKLRILPIGINYSNAKNFRSEVFVDIGEPILLSEYQSLYKADSVKAINQLTQQMHTSLKQLVVNIEQGSDSFYENILCTYRGYFVKKNQLKSFSLAEKNSFNKTLAVTLQEIHHTDPTNFERLKQRLNKHAELLSIRKTSLKGFSEQMNSPITIASIALRFLYLMVGFPFHLVGLIFNYWSYRLAYTVADKKVKQPQFHASVNFTVGMFSWILLFVFQSIIVALIFKQILVVLAFLLIIPLLGLFSIYYFSKLKKWIKDVAVYSFLKTNEGRLAKAEHEEILLELDVMTRNYTTKAGFKQPA